jgi:5-methylcytosine-specific restriction endonuclease McrA
VTHNPLMSRERVVIPDRPQPTKRQKVAVWNRENGICYLCGKPVALEGAGVRYDHRDMRSISADDSDANLYATHERCHAVKTETQDAPRHAKTIRQEKLTRPKVRKRSSLTHPTLKRTMSGQVVPR